MNEQQIKEQQIKEHKPDYTYYFADGTKCTVTVQEFGQEWIDELYDLDDKEKRNNRRNTRRHVSLEELVEHNAEPTEMDNYFMDAIFGDIQSETFAEAIKTLTSAQKRLVRQLYVEGYTQQDIAEMEGVKQQAISCRLQKIFNKIQRFFD